MKKVSKEKIAQIYAKALLDSAKSATDAKIVCKQAKELAEFLVEDKNIVSYFSSPMFSQKDKFEALNETSKKMGLCDELKRFLQIVIENNRFCEIENMLETYAKLFAEKNGYIYVTVQSVKELSKKQDKELKNNLEKLLSKKIILKYEIKPEILGGLVVLYGDSIIDDSIKGKLSSLEKNLKGI